MGTQSPSTKRPTCPLCTKPARICLCKRLKTPILHNCVAITVLQHSLEKKHPLNSARIATIGLKNVDVVTVSDVDIQASFFIRFLHGAQRVKSEIHHLFDEMPSERDYDDSVKTSDCLSAGADETCKDVLVSSSMNSELNSGGTLDAAMFGDINKYEIVDKDVETFPSGKGIGIEFTTERYGAISSFNHIRAPPTNKCSIMNFDEFLATSDDTTKGFVVRKLHRKLCEGSKEYEENEEFNVVVPPGSVLLFPSEESVDVEAVTLEVKNLIVLDGTWAKAKRMYNENPWLKLLPHIRLDMDKLSLYSEVRRQPRVGYLSTIESIVYALKAFGEDSEGLDGLLDVFESMVGDQRRCMNERLSKESESLTS